MDGFVTKYIAEMKDTKYVFIILQGCYSHSDIMSILLRRRVMSKDGSIALYAPYNDLYAAYRMKFPKSPMWGIGFQKEALKKADLIGNKGTITYTPQLTAYLRSLKIEAKALDFSKLVLKEGEVFAVVPNRNEIVNTCFHGSIEVDGKSYHRWWCKGIRNDNCGRKIDDDIEKYLRGCYNRFFWKNYIVVEENELLPQNRLIEEDREYSLLNLSSKELFDWSKREKGAVKALF